MEKEYLTILLHLGLAVLAGGLIGLERTYHGRPAGFRTHTLVCTASSLLMLLTVYQWELLKGVPLETVRVDPTRMAQGIMTGIGFLGAGVIMKEGLTVRGLTTAASIWITAAIGILFGIGFYFPGHRGNPGDAGHAVAVPLDRGGHALAVLRAPARALQAPGNAARARAARYDHAARLLGRQSELPVGDEGKVFEYQMTIRAKERKVTGVWPKR